MMLSRRGWPVRPSQVDGFWEVYACGPAESRSRCVVPGVQTPAMPDSAGYLPVLRLGPTPAPLLAPWPQLVVVADTNALASRACHAVRHGVHESLFTGLSMTGRSRIFVGAHVP